MSSPSVAILGKNSRWILKYSLRAVRSALREVGRDVEVVYVDGGSTDGSKELVREVLPQARIIDAPGTNIPEARNIAVKETSGEYLVYWDSDILAPPSALKALLQQNKPIIALTRRDVYVASEEEIQNIMAGLSEDPSPTAYSVSFVVFSVTLFHRDVFRKVGLFDERMTQAEDRDICLRAYCKGFQSFYISTTAYDINRRRLSDVPVTTPLRQYLRGIGKKALIYAYTPSRRQKINAAIFAAVHATAALGMFATPIAPAVELLPLIYQIMRYGSRKGVEMHIKALTLYTLMALFMPLRLKDICTWIGHG
ncbi:MAG: glycosyltransferase family 2 protein [Pyrobaculum sp.]|jgi:glycosyltransferase involved in cell wall biosynthesis